MAAGLTANQVFTGSIPVSLTNELAMFLLGCHPEPVTQQKSVRLISAKSLVQPQPGSL